MDLYLGYVRVSTKEQAASGLGLEAQRQALRAWASARGVALELIEDRGLSAKGARRPGLERARERLQSGDAQGLVVSKLDRLSRSTLDFSTIVNESLHAKTGWSLVCLDPDLDLTTPTGRAFATVLMAFAELERELISQRIREALAVTTKRVGRPRIPVDPEVPARIVYLRDEGGNPCSIARLLNAEGVSSPTSKRWRAAFLQGAQSPSQPPYFGSGISSNGAMSLTPM